MAILVYGFLFGFLTRLAQIMSHYYSRAPHA